jgi:hypothetical protein
MISLGNPLRIGKEGLEVLELLSCRRCGGVDPDTSGVELLELWSC